MSPRVALLTTCLAPGGAETQVARLAVELRRCGWEVAVISLLPPAAFENELAEAGVEVHSAGMRPGVPDPLGLARVVAALARFRPQVLHSHMFHANLAARAARLVCPVPVAISTLHSAAESRQNGGGLRLRDFAYRITGPLADAVVAVSQAAADRHAEAGAVRRTKLRVIPNGVDTALFRPDAARRAAVRSELGLGNEMVWLAAGRLMWKKDYPTLLRAIERQRGTVLLVAGDGPQEGELRELARTLAVDARFLGRRADIPALMNAADAFVLSSVVEGLPVALLEAMSSGLPVVATAAGGVAEVVEDAVPCGDAAALAAAMARVAGQSPEARAETGRAARARAVARFDFAVVAAQWDRLYRELLESKGAAGWM